jgi:hypothetical protein
MDIFERRMMRVYEGKTTGGWKELYNEELRRFEYNHKYYCYDKERTGDGVDV